MNGNAKRPAKHFLLPVGWGGGCGTHVPTELVRIATLEEFDVKIDSSLPPVTQIWDHNLRLLAHFASERTQRIKKNA
jgi:hypothetical protein